MRKVIICIVALAMVLFSSTGFAEQKTKQQKFELPIHSFEIGPEVSYIKYKEPGVMKEDGIMYGIGAAYTYRINAAMFRVEGKYSYGQVDYQNSGTVDEIDDYMFEIRGLLGFDYRMSDKSIITPYIGLGYRYLNDDMSGKISSTGAYGYERESNYYYSPIGVKTLSDMGNGWSWGITAEFDYFWGGQQKSHLSDVSSGFNDLENDQNDGYGYRGSLRFQKKVDTMSFIFEPFVKYWNIDKSEDKNITYSGVLIGYGYEPENESTEIGVMFMVLF